MELFAFLGLSNAIILTGAAAVLATATLVSGAVRMISLSGADGRLSRRVDNLDMKLASASDYESVLQMASNILNDVSTHAQAPVMEIFEAAASGRWSPFTRRQQPDELAASVVIDLRDSVKLAAEIARPIRNMLDNGAIEVVPERVNVALRAKAQAPQLGSKTWDRHGMALLSGTAMPSVPTTRLFDCFTRIGMLKAAVAALPRKPTANDMVQLLERCAEVIRAAGESADTFRQQVEAPAAAPSEEPAEATP